MLTHLKIESRKVRVVGFYPILLSYFIIEIYSEIAPHFGALIVVTILWIKNTFSTEL